MFVQKTFSPARIFILTKFHILWLTLWVSFVTLLFEYTEWKWLEVPWLPISVVATAVAFYVGFKNNQSYDRVWEARKIWGGIVNSSRSWGSVANSFVTNEFTQDTQSDSELKAVISRLIHRHIAWTYTLRAQLLVPTPWEHLKQHRYIAESTKRKMKLYGIGTVDDEEIKQNVYGLLNDSDIAYLEDKKNKATHILDLQYRDIQGLRASGLINDFRHMRMEENLSEFYTFQGQCERIKKFPLPRQYGGMSFVFVVIFIILLPFGMVSEFAKLGDLGMWLAIPASVLVGWVYLVMELVGDYSENPFEGLPNDIPMLSLCKTIEIDLRQILGEEDIPNPTEIKNGVLM